MFWIRIRNHGETLSKRTVLNIKNKDKKDKNKTTKKKNHPLHPQRDPAVHLVEVDGVLVVPDRHGIGDLAHGGSDELGL